MEEVEQKLKDEAALDGSEGDDLQNQTDGVDTPEDFDANKFREATERKLKLIYKAEAAIRLKQQEKKLKEDLERKDQSKKLREQTETKIWEETELKIREETEKRLKDETDRRMRDEVEKRLRESANVITDEANKTGHSLFSMFSNKKEIAILH